ncbi:hypothetical protein CHRY9390_01910 [Chryseobacterium aquaeductus]|uniref:Uncharacterized protein n=1 Tax=Chryseobacterium aquaeductus TaxID=2675056 RepID=A0A9N8MNY9_9FLAO|nr:hypothetical protein [Chryseobacterium aquaeductus]CAA7331223.1 hypothetical protein CHRY9390_01910 [Chryseobacterium potabilaquae]CAD7808916.1 hypothetical protein CHRY9390_01910 [Chryseobacterium aquaeductus]
MKKTLAIAIIGIFAFSCSKKESQKTKNKRDSTKIVDSMNAERIKINDSIKSINNENRFKNFSGSHKLTYQNDSSARISGSVNFTKIEGERDNYTVSGNIKSGENSVTLKGFVMVVTAKHMNFTGEITQRISDNDSGKPYTRKGTKTFMSKDGGKTYRLQDMVNGSGFVDHIDIHF